MLAARVLGLADVLARWCEPRVDDVEELRHLMEVA
jgi:hypothetical protein